ncbi:hypothetical protein N7533_008713 [Penicillium manginii]|jgi:hypothetical protein|uniref:uncharacterized protein n=1 Tax=Penicillium manginii TaxID=203109 RepID=UPI0025493256|nr:uncharacterized protein N7533_008713 [Penicillium manginii]KAJ5743843.1 hypothetical protein N7533_008713 [Penicillium manginii]
MKLFSSSWIYNLSHEQLEQIAGEEAAVRRKRRQLQKQAKELDTGRRILLQLVKEEFYLLELRKANFPSKWSFLRLSSK